MPDFRCAAGLCDIEYVAFAALTAAVLVSTGAVEIENRLIDSDETLSSALRDAGVDAATTQQLIYALFTVTDLRKIRPGHQLRLVREDGVVTHLDLREGPLDEFQVWLEDERYVAQKRAIACELKVARYDFDVERSLWEAAQTTGRDPMVAMALADAFGWELDLTRDARLGDRAKVLVETWVAGGRVVRYGDVLAASYVPLKGKSVDVYRYQLPTGEKALFFADGTSAQRTFLKNPVAWAPLTSRFGYRIHPILQTPQFHDGVDYAMPIGTPVRAVASGIVSQIAWTPTGGNILCLQHEDGIQTCYMHLSRIAPGIELDTPIFRRQVIAFSGNTGQTTKPHLHFSVMRDNYWVNPLKQNFPREDPVPQAQRADFARAVANYQAQLADQPIPVLPTR